MARSLKLSVSPCHLTGHRLTRASTMTTDSGPVLRRVFPLSSWKVSSQWVIRCLAWAQGHSWIKPRKCWMMRVWGVRKPASARGRTASFSILILMWLVVVSALSGDGPRRASTNAIVSSASFLPSTNLFVYPSNFSSISPKPEEPGNWPPDLPIAGDTGSITSRLNEDSREKEQEAGGIPHWRNSAGA